MSNRRVECTKITLNKTSHKVDIEKLHTLTARSLHMHSLVVSAMEFYPDSPFLFLTVDNFGLIAYDVESCEKTLTLNFREHKKVFSSASYFSFKGISCARPNQVSVLIESYGYATFEFKMAGANTAEGR